MEAAGKPTDKPNLVCGPVQICWHKFARYWDVELREIPMRPGQLFMDPKRMIEACDENTIGVVPTFGVTYTGNYEFPQPLHDALDKFQADTWYRHRHAHRRCQRWLPGTVRRPGYRLGLPPAACEIDQCFRP
ncbi:hypothetical protein AD39_1646 [Escherichia coli 1-182-04_S4_C3]|nr:hypothetical protein AD39_1646 [Escherichia coli 1-182-04_S4_C3]